MPDCPQNDTDCLPAGSNAVEPCSPCFEPTKENFLEAQAAMARQLCAVGNQVKAWNQRLDKFRNRMNRLENLVNSIPADEESALVSPCSNLADLPEDGAESILACGSGAQVGLLPDLEGCSEILGKDGKWKVGLRGLGFYPDTKLITTGWFTQAIAPAHLNMWDELNEDHCTIWAMVNFQTFLTGNTSGTGGTSICYFNGIIADTMYISNGSEDSSGGICIFPMPTKAITMAVSNNFVGSVQFTSTAVSLLGYFA